MGSPAVLIATALPEEYNAVREVLFGVERREAGIESYEVGKIDVSSTVDVAIVQFGMYNINAAAKTRFFLDRFRPRFAVFTGIAGGLKDVDVGDVVVATSVHAISMGKEAPGGFQPRGEASRTSYFLQECARIALQEQSWLRRLPAEYTPAKAVLGPIASGESVLNSTVGVIRSMIQEHYTDAKAIEMEGAGFMAGAHPAESTTLPIIVRGISDLAQFKELREGEGSQPRAAAAAAAFTIELLMNAFRAGESLDVRMTIGVLVGLMPVLYENGPRDREIWRRSGGDVARLPKADNPRTEWYRALHELEKGLGGMSIRRLLSEAMQDYPMHADLIALAGGETGGR